MSLLTAVSSLFSLGPTYEQELAAHALEIKRATWAVEDWMMEHADELPRPTREDEDVHEWFEERYADAALALNAKSPAPIGKVSMPFEDILDCYTKYTMFSRLMED